MALYELNAERLSPVSPSKFGELGIHERRDLQRVLRDQIGILVPDGFLLSEEFGNWDDSLRRIDLLALDLDANLVVVELKRNEHGGHMELQALRYAAMISTMTFEQAVEAHRRYLEKSGMSDDPQQRILDFLSWEGPDEEQFAQEVRIVLAAAEFSRELTTSVLWLNDQGLDIRCVRLQPLAYEGRVLVDVQQVIPLPGAEEYQVRVREKVLKERSRSGELWTQVRLLEVLEVQHGPSARAVAAELLEWAEPRIDQLSWGRGKQLGLVTAIVKGGGGECPMFRINTRGQLVFMVDALAGRLPFRSEESRKTLADLLNQVDGFSIAANQLDSRARIALTHLADRQAMQLIKDAIEWMVAKAREQAAS